MGDFLVNEAPRYLVLILWIGMQAYFFVYFCWVFDSSRDFFYLKLVIGKGLCIARGSAANLNFNSMLILLPVCRNLISFLRGSNQGVRRVVRRLLDKNITFHKCIAWSVVLWTAIHTGSHFWNYERITVVHSEVPGMSCIPLNAQPVQLPGVSPIKVMWTTYAGISGHLIVVALFLMVTSSMEIIRRSYFEVFWYTHHLFIIFYVGAVVHGLQGLIQGQVNTGIHDPDRCYQTYMNGSGICKIDHATDPDCDLATARFKSAGAQTWRWVVGPLVLYLVERIIRFIRAQQKVVITKVVQHPSKTIEIQMQMKGFHAEAGQYIFMQVPEISWFEWHPFTLTSSPEENYFSLHIRIAGDWTDALAKRLGVGSGEFQPAQNMPTIRIDGPFGTPSEDIFRFRTGVCIGAGIGVTPFASILKSIWYQSLNPDKQLKLKKVYLFWICPDTNSFEWFADLLKSLEDQMIEHGRADFLDYNIYLTRGWGTDEAKNIMLHEDDEQDPITGLQQKTHYGRPQWAQIFSSMAAAHKGEDLGVFFCGPKILSTKLHMMCNQHTDQAAETRFFYHKENF
ncbi:cytochrome b-245 heavy chain-like [Sycon ciliatum]|uniref:cytochrome b-245 heavy chain-like n=1 Tax=Sycon ciliatum TaxID=27933 RepID=UPI0020AC77ED|eukprot:scpid51544/ scgid20449/ Cytochrome b-245 heavy chain; CGD91-phox; Cytochrome b(558) subunit beta; Heme-binding membrane glycoprotein gp91phox; Neutrophil cytochrome b 91 kDa polypeptide; gp91-1; gp91-phox; p22 phagocyte B-cytochrome